jgi:TPP-dependent indolepyruvate ferredoxin oxidoreductase alpha subunit
MSACPSNEKGLTKGIDMDEKANEWTPPAPTPPDIDELSDIIARLLNHNTEVIIALRARCSRQRRALRQLNKAHAMLWKVINVQCEKLIEARGIKKP